MAAIISIRAMLQRVGFSAAAATYITDNQGLDTLDEMKILTDTEVENLCKVIRRPGGVIPNPAAGQAGVPAEVPNHGLQVPLRAENNLKLACYFLRYQERTSRAVTPVDVTLVNIRKLRDLRDYENDHEDLDPPDINTKNWPLTLDAIDEYLRGCLGVTKIPLAYVIRENIEIPANDPPNGYPTKSDELIARAPILDPTDNDRHTATYLADCTKVWDLLSAITREQECWTYVRPAQRTRDGRLAYTGLRGHYLGINNVDNLATKAERAIQVATYRGETRRWTLEKYVKVHVDNFNILEDLKQHGYA